MSLGTCPGFGFYRGANLCGGGSHPQEAPHSRTCALCVHGTRASLHCTHAIQGQAHPTTRDPTALQTVQSWVGPS